MLEECTVSVELFHFHLCRDLPYPPWPPHPRGRCHQPEVAYCCHGFVIPKWSPVSLCRCSILACLAYVALGLGDPVCALSYSQQLLSTPQLPGGLQYLGKMYSAEALVLMERVPEAMQLLNPDSIGDISISSMLTTHSLPHSLLLIMHHSVLQDPSLLRRSLQTHSTCPLHSLKVCCGA